MCFHCNAILNMNTMNTMNCVIRFPMVIGMFLFVSVSVGRAFTFTLSAGDVFFIPIESLSYEGTFRLPGHGSTSGLYLDVDPATLDAGESLDILLYRGSTTLPGPLDPPFM